MVEVTPLPQFALIAVSSVFIIVDPLAVAPLFVLMTASDTAAKRRQMAWRASLIAFGTLAVFALAGDVILRLFSITLGAFRIAGGIILFGIALNMLRVHGSREIQTPEDIQEGMVKDDIALMPLAFPMLSGPGAISTVIVLAHLGHTFWHRVVLLAAIAVTCATAYVVLRHAARVTALLGQTGLRLLSRLMGLLLAVIAVQFVLNGLEEAFSRMVKIWMEGQSAP